MRIDKPQPKQISFGIYKYSRIKPYGVFTHGEYKGYNIDIYDGGKKDNMKLYYISDMANRWVKSKLKYILNGVRRINKSENRNYGM